MINISVLISIYYKDDAVFFEEALESIFGQADKIAQIVLVCDGQITREQEEVILRYDKMFGNKGTEFLNPRLEKNGGLGKALQFGSQFCSGDYIVRMDSDDICSKNRFERLHRLIKKFPEAAVLGAQIEEFRRVPGDLGIKRLVPTSFSEISTYAKFRNPLNHVTACIKRETLELVGGYDDVLWHEDYFLWLTMLSKGMNLTNIDEVHVFVRIQDIGARRGGLSYLKSEVNFLRKCLKQKYLTKIDAIRYLLPRVFIRIMPSTLVSFFYRFLRG